MKINKLLQKEGIEVIAQVNLDVKQQLMENLTNKVCDLFPQFNLNKEEIYNRLMELNLYYAQLHKKMNEANYLYKNKTIYININVTKDKLEDFVLHEIIHYLQEVVDNFGVLQRMGLCKYSYLSVTGLALNEAATQYLTAYIQKKEFEEVKYFGINFKTNSPTYYPIEVALVAQLDYLIENKTLFKSTLLSTDDFFNELTKYFSRATIETILNSLDEMLTAEEKIASLNAKILQVSDRNKSVDRLIRKINNIKSNILIKFMKTQNLIFSDYFDNLYSKIVNFEQVDYYRKKLYNFRDLIGTAEGYTFFDEYYINKMVMLNQKLNDIENGNIPNALAVIKENVITKMFKKLLQVCKLNATQADYIKDNINNK